MADCAARVLAVLPQTQCRRCGFCDCQAYAHAIVDGSAGINQCPPGGAQGIERLAAVTAKAVIALNPESGSEGPRSVAFINEAWCIGCTLCIKVCPTDAIIGSNKLMHTVIEAYCTGCELCLPACPVDCIELENASGEATGWNAWSAAQASVAQQRYQFHRQRIERRAAENDATAQDRGSVIDAAVQSARARREAAKGSV